RLSFLTRSILLSASTRAGPLVSASRPRMASAASSRPRAASMSTTTMSASAAPPQAASTMARSRRRRGAKMPGVSMNTSWLAPSTAMPRTGLRVVCTLWLTIDTLAPTSRLTSVDLPAFGAPITAMKPQRVSPAGAGSLMGPPHALARQQRSGGSLLGGALARPLTARRLGALDAHFGGEARGMVGAFTADLHVLRQVAALALGPFLPRRLGIRRRGRRGLELVAPVGAHDLARRRVAGLEKNGPEQRLAGVGQDGLLVAAAAAGLRLAQDQRRSELERARNLRAGAAANEAVVEAGEVALAGGGIELAQDLGHGQPQHA